MATTSVNTRIQHKREFEINWLKATAFIPLQGELIIYLKEVDSEGNLITTLPANRTVPYLYDRIKIGDGVLNPETNKVEGTPVNDLDFFSDIGITAGTADPNANTNSQFYFKYSIT